MGERTGFRRTWFKGKPEILGTFVCRNDSDFEFSALWNGKNWIKDGYIINGVTEWTSVSLVGEEVIETYKDNGSVKSYSSLNDFDVREWVKSRDGVMSDSDARNFEDMLQKEVQETLFGRTANAHDTRTISGELSRMRELNKLYTELENQSKKLLTDINGCQYPLCGKEEIKAPVLGLAEEMAVCNDVLYARYYGIKENLEIIKNLIG